MRTTVLSLECIRPEQIHRLAIALAVNDRVVDLCLIAAGSNRRLQFDHCTMSAVCGLQTRNDLGTQSASKAEFVDENHFSGCGAGFVMK
jgi:hypothetical protein